MDFFRTGKLRWLYLLALVQLVGGPLVLLQVTVFCKLALREAPRVGMTGAAIMVWHSEDFQAVLATPDVAKINGKKTPSPNGPKLKLEKAKLPMIPWEAAPLVLADLSKRISGMDCARVWTPAWPQAPPGPPPRLG